MLKQLEAIKADFAAEIENRSADLDLDTLATKYTGKNSPLMTILKNIGKAKPEERRQLGQTANVIKKYIQTAIAEIQASIDNDLTRIDENQWMDVSKPRPKKRHGTLHPHTIVANDVVDIFKSMGFMVLDGPMMEDDFHNFGALNIPTDHPARDMQDTFWLSNGDLLRSQTSSVQIRAMERFKPPFRGIAPGRVFRNEALDASHENTFHQVECLMIDKDVSVANMVYFLRTLLSRIFRKEVKVRLRPGFFPFVEPGFELDLSCLICNGKGCSVCKQVGWIEFLGCGLVHPNVLKTSGVNPDVWSGFAFGMGLSRLVMMRYGIEDIRHLNAGDIRFLEQFAATPH